MSEPHNITEVLEQVEEKTEGEKCISIGEFLDTFEHRGYGPLLLIIALLIVLPTGGIPGVPTLLGLVIILIASQLAWGRATPWLPKRLRKVSFKKTLFDKGVEKIKPVTAKIDHLIRPRMKWLASGFPARIVGLVCIVLAAVMPFLEVIPFADIIPGSAIALLGLGLTARDGAVIIAGWTVATLAFGSASYWLLF